MDIYLLQPTYQCKNIFEIDLDYLKQSGITTIILDLDNTLIAWYRKNLQINVLKWIEKLKEYGFKLVLISNNISRKRVQFFANILDAEFINLAFKPSTRSFRKIMNQFNLEKSEIVMIGDTLWTDILAANRLGIRNIWLTEKMK